jgi:predicted DNA-binding transcriptional regulator YafY
MSMNKTDRLLSIIIELQRKKWQRAEDLAATLEVSVRTIYRDIQAISEAGVPVIGSTGVGYSLMEGYFLPPVNFTVEEAVAILIGTDFVERSLDTEYSVTADASRRKVEAVLPETIRAYAGKIRKSFRMIESEGSVNNEHEKSSIQLIRKAIAEERKISFNYYKHSLDLPQNEASDRVASPYGLLFFQGAWMLVAYCDLREQIRHFLLSRMTNVVTLESKFQYPLTFNIYDYEESDDRNLEVRVLIRGGLEMAAQEQVAFFIDRMEETSEGLLFTFRIRRPEDIIGWVLSKGSRANVLEPASLQRMVRDEAEKIFRSY